MTALHHVSYASLSRASSLVSAPPVCTHARMHEKARTHTRLAPMRKCAISRTFNLTACVLVAWHCADYCVQVRVERKDSKEDANDHGDMSASDTMANPVSPLADPGVSQPKQIYACGSVTHAHTHARTHAHTHTHTHTPRAHTHAAYTQATAAP
jgi:hypothetical protein